MWRKDDTWKRSERRHMEEVGKTAHGRGRKDDTHARKGKKKGAEKGDDRVRAGGGRSVSERGHTAGGRIDGTHARKGKKRGRRKQTAGRGR